jgi:hypothetical protein
MAEGVRRVKVKAINERDEIRNRYRIRMEALKVDSKLADGCGDRCWIQEHPTQKAANPPKNWPLLPFVSPRKSRCAQAYGNHVYLSRYPRFIV